MRRSLGVVVVVVFTLVVAACGQSQEGGDTGPVRVAFIGDFVGPLSPFSTASRDGLEIAFEEINDAGGVEGRQIEMDVFDDRNDPIQTVSIAKRMGGDYHAAFISSGSSNVLAAGPELDKNGVPWFVTVSSNPGVTSSGWEWVNRVHLSDADQIERIVEFAVEDRGLQRIGVIHDTSDFGQGGADLLRDALDDRVLELAADEAFNVGANDFSTQINALRDANLDGLVAWALADSAARIVEQLRAVGVDIQVFGGGGVVSAGFLELAGPAAEGTVASWAYLDPQRPEVQALTETYQGETGRELDVFAAQSYDAGHILAQSIGDAGGTDPEALQEAIRSIRYRGAVGEVAFDDDGQNIREIHIGRVQNGEWTLVE